MAPDMRLRRRGRTGHVLVVGAIFTLSGRFACVFATGGENEGNCEHFLWSRLRDELELSLFSLCGALVVKLTLGQADEKSSGGRTQKNKSKERKLNQKEALFVNI